MVKFFRGAYCNEHKTALQRVTAYDTGRELVLSQKPTVTRNDEISVVRQMLDILNIKGSIIRIDALHCQRETLEKISEKKAHSIKVNMDLYKNPQELIVININWLNNLYLVNVIVN